jgi:DNA polymerase-3 subunit alpha
VIERAVQGAASIQRDKQRGQKNLFGGDDDEEVAPAAGAGPSTLPEIPEWNKREMLAFEKEALGFFLTSHPLAEMSTIIKQFSTHEVKQLVDVADTETVILGGMVSAIKKAQTKKPSRNGHQKYVNFDFEDPTGVVRCIMWPEEFARLGEKVEVEQIRFVRGKIDKRNREPNVIIDAMWSLEEVEKEFTHQVLIKFQKGLHDIRVIERVRDIIQKTPGKAEVVLVVDIAGDGPTRMRYITLKPLEQKIAVNREMRRELSETVGEDNVKFVADLKKKNMNGQSVGR